MPLSPILLERTDQGCYGTTTLAYGDGKDVPAQKKLLTEIGCPEKSLVTCKQVHGNRVARVHNPMVRQFADTDGLLSDIPGVVLGVFTADCVPIFMHESHMRVYGVLHAGWRGALMKIAQIGVEMIKQNWDVDPSGLKVHLGPHIRECCFKVGTEVAQLFPRTAQKIEEKGIRLNLERFIFDSLIMVGVKVENMSASAHCTVCDDRFYSHRRNRGPERMLNFIVKSGTQII